MHNLMYNEKNHIIFVLNVDIIMRRRYQLKNVISEIRDHFKEVENFLRHNI